MTLRWQKLEERDLLFIDTMESGLDSQGVFEGPRSLLPRAPEKSQSV
jgi:hypothetical protein